MAEFPASVIKLVERVSDPGAGVDKGKTYTKDVSGVTQLFYQASDGTVSQATPVLPSAGSIAFSQRTTLLTSGSGTTVPAATLTNVFPSARDEATLAASSTYAFIAHYILTNSPTASNFSVQFGGTATFATFEYAFSNWSASGERQYGIANTAGAVPMYAANRATPYVLQLDGTIVTTAAGTLIPQITMTVGGATATLQPGSFFEIVYLGPSTFVSQGGWG